jgi:hypothetical protein
LRDALLCQNLFAGFNHTRSATYIDLYGSIIRDILFDEIGYTSLFPFPLILLCWSGKGRYKSEVGYYPLQLF